MSGYTRREFAGMAARGAAAAAVTSALPWSAAARGQERPAASPNIIWIFTDDHACQALGAYGGRFATHNITPNIDALARQGMIFHRSHVANSISAPSRATLLTGKHSHLNGQYTNQSRFDHSQQQFQKILQTSGYQTALVGKIHLDGKMQGFDYWEVLPGQGRYLNPRFITATGTTRYPNQHSTDVITERAMNWLDHGRAKDQPFMLMVHYKAPHRRWQPTPRWQEKFKDRTFPEPDNLIDDYQGRGTAARNQAMTILKDMSMLRADRPERQAELAKIDADDPKALTRLKYQWYMRDYLACVAGVDENIGKLMAYLKDNGLDDNTVVMYSSDQGFYLGEHGWFDKRFMYEPSFRTPLIVRWPGVVKPGTSNDDLVQNIDWAETFLDIAGAPIPDDMQGRSLVPLLQGKTPDDWRTSLYYHYYEYPGYHSVRRHEGVADKRYKLIRFYGPDVPGGEEWEFYDLQADPREMQSIYSDPAQQQQIAAMKKELARLRNYYRVPTPTR